MGESCINEVLQSLCGRVPARVSLGALAFMGFVMMTSVRVNISVAIVAMVRQNTSTTITTQAQCSPGNQSKWAGPKEEEIFNKTIPLTQWLQEDLGGEDQEDDGKEGDEALLDWDEVIQGLVISSFFYGYAFTQVIGGRFAELYGTRITFGVCGLTSGFFTLVSPVAARSHYGALIAVRVLMGFFQGPMWPSMHALLPRWVPPLERSRFVAAVNFGSSLSMMMTMAVTGVIVDTLGPDASFYIPGTICLIWAFFWFLLVSDDPRQHPRISQQEQQYIENALRVAGSSCTSPKKVPWRDVMSCVPFWALVVVDMGNVFCLSVYFSQLPTYMKNVLGFSIKENGLVSSLPFLCRYIGAISFSTLGDWLLASGRISLRTCRRVCSAVAMFCPAILCIATAYSGCSATSTVFLLCLTNFTNGAVVSGILVNFTDIAPNFSGTLFGIGNTFCAFVMFLAPVSVGAIIQGQQTMSQWRKVFWMCVPLYTVPEVIYLIFCSTTVQRWNSDDEAEEEAAGSKTSITLNLEKTKKELKA